MKKKLVAVAMCVCLGMTLFGCGKESEEKESSTKNTAASSVYTEDDLVDDTAGELNISDYVELAAYSGLELTKEVNEVTDEDVQTEMESATVEITSADAVVQDGDSTVIDFEGKIDGVAFSGGTASDYTLVIGSGAFIDGFEDGLIGVAKGATVDLNLTFPEDYQNAEYAGKAVVFTVTVNKIQRTPAELTDAWFSANTDYATLADYQAEVRQHLETEEEETGQYNVEAAALEEVVSNSKVKKYYKSLVEEGENQYESYMNTYASYYGVTLSALLEAQGMSEDDFEKAKAEQGIYYAESAMIVRAIAQDAGLSTEDETYQSILNELAQQYGMTADLFVSNYGESYVTTSIMSEYVMQYMVANSNVTTKVITQEETSAE
ncbi:MAG: trigger factor [Lachnospiraceae bacterium]|nr:trigger factor [Lachnospiraceae bacterium]